MLTYSVWDINDHGEVLGQGRDTTGANWVGILWKPGEPPICFEVPGAACTNAIGIDNAGNIVGSYSVDPCSTPGLLTSGFLRAPDGTFTFPIDVNLAGAVSTEVSDINSAGEMVGMYQDASGNRRAFFRDSSGNDADISPPGSTSAAARRITDAGRIGGRANFGTACSSAWILETSGYTILQHPTANWTSVEGISDYRSEVVGIEIANQGATCDNGTVPSPRVYFERAGQVTTLTPPWGGTWMIATGMNERGDIVGFVKGTVGGFPPGGYVGRRISGLVTR